MLCYFVLKSVTAGLYVTGIRLKSMLLSPMEGAVALSEFLNLSKKVWALKNGSLANGKCCWYNFLRDT